MEPAEAVQAGEWNTPAVLGRGRAPRIFEDRYPKLETTGVRAVAMHGWCPASGMQVVKGCSIGRLVLKVVVAIYVYMLAASLGDGYLPFHFVWALRLPFHLKARSIFSYAT